MLTPDNAAAAGIADAWTLVQREALQVRIRERGDGDHWELLRYQGPLPGQKQLTVAREQAILEGLQLLAGCGLVHQTRPVVDAGDSSCYTVTFVCSSGSLPTATAERGESTLGFLSAARVSAALALAVESGHAYATSGHLPGPPLTGWALVFLFVAAELLELLRAILRRIRRWWLSL